MSDLSRQPPRTGVTVGLWALLGAMTVAAFMVGRFSAPGPETTTVERATFRGAALTSPFLEGPGTENGDPTMVRTRQRVQAHISDRRAADPTLRVSVYARDLDTGAWFGIDDRDRFIPGSLTKVVVLIRALQLEEEEGGLLNREVLFPGPHATTGEDSMAGAPDSLRLRPGGIYPVSDLLRRMMVYSDNYSYELVLGLVASEGIPHMLYELSAEQSVENGRFYFDARTVAVLLRSLYHRSFLGRRHSEMALRLLAETRYSEGLRRFLPPDATVASKYGFIDVQTDGEAHRELHECGIIYRPPSPYVLCVMTSTDRPGTVALDEVIGEISRMVWAQ